MAKTELKNLIIAYRSQGLSYNEIAEKLLVTSEYARTVFSRSSRKRTKDVVINPSGSCKFCGKPVQSITGKKERFFCCPECRDKYHNQLKSRKPYVLVCEYCGNEFVAYGNPVKCFCSRECQTLARRKGE